MGRSKHPRSENKPTAHKTSQKNGFGKPVKAAGALKALKKSLDSTGSAKPQQQQKQQRKQKDVQYTIPFEPNDRILLVGEGDFSFAHSIVLHHGCANVFATTNDTRSECETKYPQAVELINYLEEEEQHVLHGIDATKLKDRKIAKTEHGWDRIIFNFPHTGGKSTDVNRQVRYNQELLVSFFRAAVPLLSSFTPHEPVSLHPTFPMSTIIVTLFEQEPYTLWNIKDLARHVGLVVVTSFRFHAEAYPGYRHARTLGNFVGEGAWKGEERSARTYVFQRKEDAEEQGHNAGGRKRRRGEESNDDDDD